MLLLSVQLTIRTGREEAIVANDCEPTCGYLAKDDSRVGWKNGSVASI